MPLPVTTSTYIAEPILAQATAEIEADDMGAVGPRGRPLRRQRVTSYARTEFGDSLENGNVAVAPAGGTVLATVTPTAGTWEIQANVSIQGDVADMDNVQFLKAALVLTTLALGLSPVFRKVLDGATAVKVVTAGGSTPNSVYGATISAKQVG